jgi:IclR family transcriptional regulator, KDG regulon repressor
MPRMVPAVARSFAILDLLKKRGPLSIPEISAQLRLPRSTAHDLVTTLVALDVLEATPEDSHRFELGLVLHELGSAYLFEVDLAREGQQVAATVARSCGETVHLASLDGTEVVYLAKVDSIHEVRMVSAVGRRLPAHCTAVGKALLSGLTDAELGALYGAGTLPAMTPDSITSLAALRRQLARVRVDGIALDDCESNRDVRCVAAPVLDHTGRIVAAMSISVPTIRCGVDWPEGLADLVREGARDLSRRLGNQEPEGRSQPAGSVG